MSIAEKPAILRDGADLFDIMIAMGRSGEEPGRVIGENCRGGFRHDAREIVVLNAIPNINTKAAPWFQNPTRFAIAGDPVRKNITPNWPAQTASGVVFERQSKTSACRRDEPLIRALPANSSVQHGLIEIGDDIAGARVEAGRGRGSTTPPFQDMCGMRLGNAARRDRRHRPRR